MMVLIAKKLLLDSETTSLEFNIFRDQSNTQLNDQGGWPLGRDPSKMLPIMKIMNFPNSPTSYDALSYELWARFPFYSTYFLSLWFLAY